jgi:hypothetical protein
MDMWCKPQIPILEPKMQIDESAVGTDVTPNAPDKPQSEPNEVNAEALAEQDKASRLVSLDAEALFWIPRGVETNLAIGRIFIAIKDLLPHGQWKPYFAEKYAPLGIALRTAQLYMRLARTADAAAKNADSALFPAATDPQAKDVIAGVTQAQDEVAHAGGATAPKSRRKPRQRVVLDGLYKLPLFLTGDQKNCLDELRKSANWPGAQKQIIATLDQLFAQNGIVNDPTSAERHGTPERNRAETLQEETYAATDTDLPDVFAGDTAADQEAEYEDALA